jgi:BirA family transcriptional regulator, biotin operon repressor / biotin---[acetyl-CoA-carboxylase] ligase
MPAAALARRWGVPQCGLYSQLGSTLDAVHELAAQGAPPGAVVLAEEQTAGRGQGGRGWRSPPGGVWLGVLLRPPHGALRVLSLRAGLVVADVVDELTGRSVAQLKWPNDVLLAERKLAGVLCEGRWQGDALQWLALGVGVNVVNPLPAEVASRAIALGEWVPGVRRLDVLDRLVPTLVRLADGGARLTDAECVAFGMRDWLRGRQLRTPVFGRGAGIRADGALLVDTGAGTTVVREGHVELA